MGHYVALVREVEEANLDVCGGGGGPRARQEDTTSIALAIRNPVETALSVHKASLAATCHLTVSLLDPATLFDPGAHRTCATKAKLAARRDRLQNEQIFLNLCSRDKPAMARWNKQNSAAGAWLSVFPIRLNGTSLWADKWRDNVCLWYNHSAGYARCL